jgi:hypothetical protein
MLMRLIWVWVWVSLVCCLVLAVGFVAGVGVGVKAGDWVEYDVAFTGDASLGHDVVWARLDVLAVRDTTVDLNVSTRSTGGTVESGPTTVNLGTGELSDAFIIPAGLSVGDVFYDRSQGNVTIAGLDKQVVAGAERDVISAANNVTVYSWDRATGVLVEAHSVYPAYTLDTKINGTNSWQTQTPELGQALFIALSAVAIGIVAVVAVLLLRRRKSRGKDN